MIDFKGYVISLIVAAVIITLAEELSPRALRPAVSLCLGVYLLCTLVSPLASFIGGGFSAEDFIPDSSLEENEGGYSDTVTLATAKGIGRAVAERFGFSEELIEVTLVGFDVYELTAERVYIRLTGRAAYIDFHAAERYVEEIIGGKNGESTKCTAELSFK